ncbi:MAG: thioredoxin domain-containing protein [Acidobacteria bacterium]|nr:thioredoxin domain-containing protein [Acidobacteriota bacterium]
MSKEAGNRLAGETSPYLLQHAGNPVDWYPWGEEAFEAARAANRPVFLSIGYSACHWCHVMAHESFEDERIAALLNENFVSIKVDREERPEIDAIYMQAVQMMTGHGGWPMSVFLTPDGRPFFAGTYFPPTDQRGMPGFDRILEHVSRIWSERRDAVDEVASEVRDAIRASSKAKEGALAVEAERLTAAAWASVSQFDSTWGGFGSAPKFPQAMHLSWLLKVARRTTAPELAAMVTTTLDRMAEGGIYDHLGGGFARYSVDREWRVPHFEKMLYDNALLSSVYTEAWQYSGERRYERVVHETLEFVKREMTSPEGGFYSALDADSEGEEGKFYVWTRDEIIELLGDDRGQRFADLYDVTGEGNFEHGKSVLRLPRDGQAPDGEWLEEARAQLLAEREKRVRPGRDDKVIAAWNGWMLAAWSEAAVAFRRPEYLEVAKRSAGFLLEHLVSDDGRVMRIWKDGRVRFEGILEDHAGVGWGLVAAFEATQDRRYLDAARKIGEVILERFSSEDGPFWDTAADHESLIARPRDTFDSATPSGNSLAVRLLQKLAAYFDAPRFEEAADRAMLALMPVALHYPNGYGFLLSAAEWHLSRPVEIAITGEAGESKEAFWRAVGESYVPHRIIADSRAGALPLLEGKPSDEAAVWLCRNYTCEAPIEDPDEVRKKLA